ncbi:MAG: LysR family transcriptional regulator [Burkholderiales bacterium]|nr:LysR family transcriptional regulator [Burkholderiales bacterium]
MRDIEYFAVVAEHGHLGRAAEALGLSTPALSKSLRRIEKSLQAKLVKRTPKGVELTAIGAALVTHATRLRVSFDDVAREAANLREGRVGDLRVGASPGLAEYLLPAATDALLRAAPGATITVTVGTGTVKLLQNGELDLVLALNLPPVDKGLIQEHLYDDEVLVYASNNHRLAKKKSVTLSDIAQEQWAMASPNALPFRWLRQTLEEHGLPIPKATTVSNSLWLRLKTVEATNLLGFSAKRIFRHAAARADLKELSVKDLACVWRVGIIYRKDAYLSPVARRFIEILRATATIVE